MNTRALLFSGLTIAIAAPVFADQQYMLHEALHSGQKVACELNFDYHVKTNTTTNGRHPETDDTDTKQYYKFVMTVLEATDGSATKASVYIDPASCDINQERGEVKTPLPFAGKTIELRRLRDETVADDYRGKDDDGDIDTVKDFLDPDEDFYPDKPVAVGDTWDASDKLSRHSDLGPKDQLLAQCRLDAVNIVGGKQIAQITCSSAEIRHEEGNIEEDVETKIELTVDIAAGQIIKSDLTSKSKYITPAGEATQVTGGVENVSHCEVIPVTPATTQP